MPFFAKFRDQFDVKQAMVGIAIFVGGGVAYYTFARVFTKRQRRYQNAHVDDISEVKKDIVDLKRNLGFAIADFRKEVDGIRKSLVRKRVTTTGRISALHDICIDVDRLNDGTDEDKENAMRILQDQEIIRPNSWEILWRLARAHVSFFDIREAKDVKHLHATSALDYAKQAIQLNPDSVEAHKWVAISLGITTDYLSTKEKIESGYELKKHIDRALELDPQEPVLHYMKGRWCWGVYMLTWIERKLASTLFAVPPTSTVEEAMESFHRAEELEPGFHKANRYYLAKCYYEKKNYTEAKEWCLAALNMPETTKDDKDTHKEAQTLMDKL